MAAQSPDDTSADVDENVNLWYKALKESECINKYANERKYRCGGNRALCGEFPLKPCAHHRILGGGKDYPFKFCLRSQMDLILEELDFLNQVDDIPMLSRASCDRRRIGKLESRLVEIRTKLPPTHLTEN